MNEKTAAPWIPDWIPDRGHALRHAGIHFDAVRMTGSPAERVASELMSATDFDAGPIIRAMKGGRTLYFLLPPNGTARRRWPRGVRTLTRGDGCLAYVGVPALSGDTWPLDWRSTPTEQAPYVVPELLHAVVGRLTACDRTVQRYAR